MQAISYKRHRFRPEIIRLSVWLYYRFTLSLREVEELLAERGIDVSYETVRCWTISSVRRSPPTSAGCVGEQIMSGISTRWS